MALKWHREAVWRRAGDPDIFGSGTTYRIFGTGGPIPPWGWRRSDPGARRRRAAGRVAALVVGALPALAFPAPSWWWLAWVGVVPLLLVVRAAPTAREGGVRAWRKKYSSICATGSGTSVASRSTMRSDNVVACAAASRRPSVIPTSSKFAMITSTAPARAAASMSCAPSGVSGA